jgi:Zn-dependent peptidase ImmA (M78 family)
MNRNANYAELLQLAAEELAKGKDLPIDMHAVCKQLEVNVARYQLPANKAQLVRTKSGVEIRLPDQPFGGEEYSRHERFLVAHELGHLILERGCAVTPLNNSEYWQHEELCDHFARMLLLPRAIVERKLRGVKATPKQLLGITTHLASRAYVSWSVAAFSVSASSDGAAFLALAVEDGGGFRVTMSTLPGKKEIGRKISATGDFGRKIAEHVRDKKPFDIDQAMLSSSRAPSLRNARAAQR